LVANWVQFVGVYGYATYRDKVVGVFVRFRAPLWSRYRHSHITLPSILRMTVKRAGARF
jgi:hypothetical protein